LTTLISIEQKSLEYLIDAQYILANSPLIPENTDALWLLTDHADPLWQVVQQSQL
jgi:hypothetical protein